VSRLLTLNAGSSSIKFAVYAAGDPPARRAVGQVDRIGSDAAVLDLRVAGVAAQERIGAADHAGAVAAILQALPAVLGAEAVTGVGHRIVHGGPDQDRPARLTPALRAELRALAPLAPLHQPHNLAAVDAAIAAFPGAVQVACFDTAFHRRQPWVSDTYGLPPRFHTAGIRRYGFHGLSYSYVSAAHARLDPMAAAGRVVIAHLGNGASMCALRGGVPQGSTMGFSPLDGLPMGTRCGQIDPGVLLYLMQHEGLSVDAVSDLLWRDSGLKGMSGLGNDMRMLEAAGTPEAEAAIAYFVHRIRRELGALAAVLGGLDAVVFCGGIGEHSARVRAEVCAGMDWLGLALDAAANAANAPLISAGTVPVRIVPTDEEAVIAGAVQAALA
jgi:acetate kinase